VGLPVEPGMSIATNIDHIAVRPGDEEYAAASTTYMGTGTPVIVFRPTTAAEVAGGVRHAVDSGLELAVRSGGHNALNFGNSDTGVVIDLSRFDSVEVLEGDRVRIGAGATWGHVAAELAPYGLALTSGDTGSVGVGGLAQGGGMGWMVRKYGLTVDSIVAAEVVTAAGQVVRATSHENPDLLWGIRGGGGNFGVVTTFEFQAQRVSTVHSGMLTYAPGDTAGTAKAWTRVMREAPDELTTALLMLPPMGDFPGGLSVFVCYCGDDPTAIEPLRRIGTVVSDDVVEKPYADVLAEPHPPQNLVPVITNTLVSTLSDECIDEVASMYDEGGRVVFMRALGGAMARVAPEATAFGHRDVEAMIVSAVFLPAGSSAEDVASARAGWAPVAAQGCGAYAGFINSATADDLATFYPAGTRERLVEVKRAWDPDNIFRRNFNIQP
jgi:hypothetical protein